VRRLAGLALALVAAIVTAVWGSQTLRDLVKEPLTRAAVAVLVAPRHRTAPYARVRAAPTRKLEPSAAVVDGRLYVFGGFVTTPRPREFPVEPRVDVYDPARDAWARVADLPRKITHANAVVAEGGGARPEVWMVGGFEGDEPGRAVASVLIYDPRRDAWRDGPPLPTPVAGGTLALVDGALHYVGGFLPDRDTAVGTQWRLVLGTTTWEPRAPLPMARGHLASAVLGGKLYAIGGQIRHDTWPRDLDAVDVYDPARDAWSAVASLPTPRSHCEAATFVDHERIVVAGGRDNTRWPLVRRAGLADVVVYDPARDRWTERPGLPVGIESPVARLVGGRMIVTAGALAGDVVPQPDTFAVALALTDEID
jgi:Kelch motif